MQNYKKDAEHERSARIKLEKNLQDRSAAAVQVGTKIRFKGSDRQRVGYRCRIVHSAIKLLFETKIVVTRIDVINIIISNYRMRLSTRKSKTV